MMRELSGELDPGQGPGPGGEDATKKESRRGRRGREKEERGGRGVEGEGAREKEGAGREKEGERDKAKGSEGEGGSVACVDFKLDMSELHTALPGLAISEPPGQ